MVNKVQQGHFNAGGGTQTDITIEEVDLTKTILMVNYTANNSRPIRSWTWRLLNSTTIRFERLTTTVLNAPISWTVIENDDFNVQHISTQIEDEELEKDVTISEVSLSKSFVISCFGNNNSNENNVFQRQYYTTDLINSTTVKLKRGNSTQYTNCNIQVVEIEGAKVQKHVWSSGNPKIIELAESVNLNHSFILSNYWGSDNNSQRTIMVRFNNEEEIEVVTHSGNEVVIYVVEYDKFFVKHLDVSNVRTIYIPNQVVNQSNLFLIKSLSTTISNISNTAYYFEARITNDNILRLSIVPTVSTGLVYDLTLTFIYPSIGVDISGVVKKGTTLIENAKVTLIDSESNKVFHSVNTNENGEYKFVGTVKDRDYHVLVEYKDEEGKYHSKSYPYVRFESEE